MHSNLIPSTQGLTGLGLNSNFKALAFYNGNNENVCMFVQGDILHT